MVLTNMRFECHTKECRVSLMLQEETRYVRNHGTQQLNTIAIVLLDDCAHRLQISPFS